MDNLTCAIGGGEAQLYCSPRVCQEVVVLAPSTLWSGVPVLQHQLDGVLPYIEPPGQLRDGGLGVQTLWCGTALCYRFSNRACRLSLCSQCGVSALAGMLDRACRCSALRLMQNQPTFVIVTLSDRTARAAVVRGSCHAPRHDRLRSCRRKRSTRRAAPSVPCRDSLVQWNEKKEPRRAPMICVCWRGYRIFL